MVHTQEGWPDLIAVDLKNWEDFRTSETGSSGTTESCKLTHSLTGFVGTDGNSIYYGSPLVAQVNSGVIQFAG